MLHVQMRAAEALATRRYLCDDAEISRKVRAKVGAYRQLCSAADGCEAELRALQPPPEPADSAGEEFAVEPDFSFARNDAQRNNNSSSSSNNNISNNNNNNKNNNGKSNVNYSLMGPPPPPPPLPPQLRALQDSGAKAAAGSGRGGGGGGGGDGGGGGGGGGGDHGFGGSDTEESYPETVERMRRENKARLNALLRGGPSERPPRNGGAERRSLWSWHSKEEVGKSSPLRPS
jgi:hypothetical protein